ncbi:hypothetical protein DFR68_103741 [Nocardia mexicana]|uniref:Uncharacterized protein n=1 Tax=Nocardia mexicana TaxID=279262 RepID=A0A370H9M2_9NOCA|nr:hypothetical protein DFR68_103741 [Nocardia mexicana]
MSPPPPQPKKPKLGLIVLIVLGVVVLLFVLLYVIGFLSFITSHRDAEGGGRAATTSSFVAPSHGRAGLDCPSAVADAQSRAAFRTAAMTSWQTAAPMLCP